LVQNDKTGISPICKNRSGLTKKKKKKQGKNPKKTTLKPLKYYYYMIQLSQFGVTCPKGMN
jgi:hypothetical protein